MGQESRVSTRQSCEGGNSCGWRKVSHRLGKGGELFRLAKWDSKRKEIFFSMFWNHFQN
jgi:hypothetical protein